MIILRWHVVFFFTNGTLRLISGSFAVGRGGWTLWVGFTLWTTSPGAPRGSGPPWRRCVTMSNGSTSAVSCREPCNSSTRDSYLGWGNYIYILHYYTDLWNSDWSVANSEAKIILFYILLFYLIFSFNLH